MDMRVKTYGRGCSDLAGGRNGGRLKHDRLSIGFSSRTKTSTTILFHTFLTLALFPAISSSCDVQESSISSDLTLELENIDVSKSPDGGKRLHIFLFDDDSLKRLDSYQRAAVSDKVRISSRNGKKILCVLLAGDFDCSGIEGYEGLCKKKLKLMDDSRSSPCKRAECRVNMGVDRELSLKLEPFMAEIKLERIRCDFSGKPYNGETIHNPSAYLTNVNAQCGIMDTDSTLTGIILNCGEYSESDDMECDRMLSADIMRDIDRNWQYVEASMFCYANTNSQEGPGAPFTRLVIEGEIGGEKYWWPIDINRKGFGWEHGREGIAGGSFHELSITVMRLGSKDPDTPVTPCDVCISHEVLPWNMFDKRYEIY